jgi:hypothetical protein
MKINNYLKFATAGAFSAALGLFGCSDALLEEKPPHLITSETLYTSYAGLDAGVNGLYAAVRTELEGLNGSSAQVSDTFMNGTDNVVTNHSVAGYNSLAQGFGSAYNPSVSYFSDIFEWLYRVVNASNTIINQVNEKGNEINWNGGVGTPAENKNRILAEAHAVRAWAYRHLSFLWGDVPLNLNTALGSTIRTDWERTPVASVRKQIIADLSFAEKHLPVEGTRPGRMTKGAVQHYLSEMYLTVNKADSALYWAEKVIANPAYRLITKRYGVKAAQPGVPFMDMFYEGNSNRAEGNTEALWVFQFEFQVNGGGEGNMRRHHISRYSTIRVGSVTPLQLTVDRGGQGYGRMSLTKWAIDCYEPQDDRASNHAIRKYFILQDKDANAPFDADRLPAGYNYGDTIKLNWANDITNTSRGRADWPFSRKYDWANKDNVGGNPQYNDQIYLRLADTYLLKAEAEFKQGKLSEAAETINVIRRRSNATPVTADQLTLDFILDERSRELVLEEHRRYTLLRNDKWKERTARYNKNGGQFVEDKHVLFPIPQSVIDANLTGEFTQNSGY